MKKSYIILILGIFTSLFLPIHSMEHTIEDTGDPITISELSNPEITDQDLILAEQEAEDAKQALHSCIDKYKNYIANLKRSIRVKQSIAANNLTSPDDPQEFLDTDEDPAKETAEQKLISLKEKLEKLKVSAQKKALIWLYKKRMNIIQKRIKTDYEEFTAAMSHLKELSYDPESEEYFDAKELFALSKDLLENHSQFLLNLQNKVFALLHNPITSIELSHEDQSIIQSVLKREDEFEIEDAFQI